MNKHMDKKKPIKGPSRMDKLEYGCMSSVKGNKRASKIILGFVQIFIVLLMALIVYCIFRLS